MIGNHTYDHRYDKLYGHFQDFWGQIKKTEEIIRLITGERPQLVRAPGERPAILTKPIFNS